MTRSDFSQLPTQAEALLAKLDTLDIVHETTNHPPVFTVEEAKSVRHLVKGAHTKNLFLRNKRGALWLVTVMENKRVDLKALGLVLGAEKLSFAKPEQLVQHLGVFPGSVTPFALINDPSRAVTLVLDQDLLAEETLNFHPLRNDQTTNIAAQDLLVFAEAVFHRPHVISIPQRTVL